MFVHQSQLAYQLVAADYRSPEQHQLECERLFLPAWHMIGAASDLPREGDFATLELLGQPIIVHHFQGALAAFLNVCAHRHCRLTDQVCGHQAAMRCQYHGWEYGPDGHTRRIPDAGCFRPFDRAHAQLHKLRLETCGDLLFVSLAEQGPSLRDFLGECYALLGEMTGRQCRCVWRWQYDYPCNWKLPVENTVETYHLPYLHKATFSGVYPSEEAQTHELNDRVNVLRYDLCEDARITRVQRWFTRQLGGTSTDVYSHWLVYPNFVFTTSDLLLHTHTYLPLTPTTSRAIVRLYSFQGTRRDPWRRVLASLLAFNGRRMDRLIQLEDASVFAAQQRGIEVSPHAGCLGTREERIWAFQRYVVENAGSQGRPRAEAQPQIVVTG